MINEEKLNQINEAAAKSCSVALSKLINKGVELVFSNPMTINIKEISHVIGYSELGVGIYLHITGNVTGLGFFLFPKETALNLCDLAMKKEFRTIKEISFFDVGVLKETGNILLGNYLTVLSNNLKTEIVGSMPNFSAGMFSAILEEVTPDFAKGFNEALVVKVELLVVNVMNMKGYLIILFKPCDIEALLNIL